MGKPQCAAPWNVEINANAPSKIHYCGNLGLLATPLNLSTCKKAISFHNSRDFLNVPRWWWWTKDQLTKRHNFVEYWKINLGLCCKFSTCLHEYDPSFLEIFKHLKNGPSGCHGIYFCSSSPLVVYPPPLVLTTGQLSPSEIQCTKHWPFHENATLNFHVQAF